MNLTIRKGKLADADNYIELLRHARSLMTHKEWFYLDKSEDVHTWLGNGVMELWVAEDDNGRLAGGFNIPLPGLEDYNYGYDLGLSREELLRVIHMDTAVVHPDFRGHKLQRRLMTVIEQDLFARYPDCILLTTVHPENIYSLSNVRSLGYEPVKRLAKYGSERYILRKDAP